VDAATLDHHVERQLEGLRHEFAGEIPAGRVNTIGNAYYDDLRSEARILDFIPMLVYRYAHEELLSLRHDVAAGRAPQRRALPAQGRQYA
jgi:hypothetical protein